MMGYGALSRILQEQRGSDLRKRPWQYGSMKEDVFGGQEVALERKN